jgi:hypothetical protein
VVPLQSPNGAIWGEFVVARVVVKPIFMLPDGTLIATDVEIALGDLGLPRGVLPPPTPIAVVGTSGPTTTELPEEDRSTPAEDITPRQIARLP